MTISTSSPMLRVLLVEDSPTSAMLVQEELAHADDASFTILHVDCLEKALERLRAGGVDVVLLDLWLPDSEGMETFLKAHRQAPHIPVVVMSGVDDQQFALQALQEGAQDYLVKGHGDGFLLARTLRHAVERQRVREELAEERAFLRSVLDTLPDQIYVKDTAYRFIVANKPAADFFGLTPDLVIGKTDIDFFPRELALQFGDEEAALIKTQVPLVNREVAVTDHAGQQHWVTTTKVPLHDRHGQIIGLVGINRDITDRKRWERQLEELNFDLARSQNEMLQVLEDLKKSHKELRAAQMQLIDAEKLESVGRLAAGVAHEVKNPLAILLMGIDCLAAGPCANDKTVKAVLDDMRDAVTRGDAIVRGLLEFSAVRKLDLVEEDLNRLLRKALLLVRHELLKANVVVVQHLDESLPVVLADRIKLQQVFVNVFMNAIHAMPEGGTLTVTTRCGTVGDVQRDPGERAADRLRTGELVLEVDVDDTGHGIPPEKISKVFDPFFTTKPTGVGTGLGLTVVKKIVELHGGQIRLMNRPEGGVRVAVLLRPGQLAAAGEAARV